MSICTSIDFFNSTETRFRAALTTPETKAAWEEEYGPVEDRPGHLVAYGSDHESISETNDEYGGWIIDLSKIPGGTTHIVVHRG
jgi:hypothetical protein